MKTAIICPICLKPKRESDSYAMKITDYRLDKAIEYNLPNTKIQDRIHLFHQVRVCRPCTKRMGYKTKVAKKPTRKEAQNEQTTS